MARRYIIGSLVKKRKHLNRLPDGAVVRNACDNPMIVRHGSMVGSFGWHASAYTIGKSGPSIPLWDDYDAAPPYLVVSLPGQ